MLRQKRPSMFSLSYSAVRSCTHTQKKSWWTWNFICGTTKIIKTYTFIFQFPFVTLWYGIDDENCDSIAWMCFMNSFDFSISSMRTLNYSLMKSNHTSFWEHICIQVENLTHEPQILRHFTGAHLVTTTVHWCPSCNYNCTLVPIS